MAKDFKHFTFLHVILGKSINVVKEKKKKIKQLLQQDNIPFKD